MTENRSAMGLREGEGTTIQHFTFPLDLSASLAERLAQLLDSSESEVSLRFVSEELRRRHATAHGILRLLLASATGQQPDRLGMAKGPQGKPELIPATGCTDIAFNLSRSAGFGAVAICIGAPVGIDIECWNSFPDANRLLLSVLTAEEFKMFTTMGLAVDNAESELLLRSWVVKESILKASGFGLSVEPKAVCIEPERLGAYWRGCHETLSARLTDAPGGALKDVDFMVLPFKFKGGVGAVAQVAETGDQIALEHFDMNESDIRHLYQRTTHTDA